jgi:hypothetical protein
MHAQSSSAHGEQQSGTEGEQDASAAEEQGCEEGSGDFEGEELTPLEADVALAAQQVRLHVPLAMTQAQS